ncbi:MAG: hypothetical protein VB025_12680 [Sphaerochaeta sp.]|nr:hypothetical protein [Sphaerochaeta sp.]
MKIHMVILLGMLIALIPGCATKTVEQAIAPVPAEKVDRSTAEFSTRIIQLFELIAYFPVPRINF